MWAYRTDPELLGSETSEPSEPFEPSEPSETSGLLLRNSGEGQLKTFNIIISLTL
jgi:hypothetical protein